MTIRASYEEACSLHGREKADEMWANAEAYRLPDAPAGASNNIASRARAGGAPYELEVSDAMKKLRESMSGYSAKRPG